MNSVTLLGVKGGPALYPSGSWPTSSLLRLGGREILVDCGLGATRGLVEQGVPLKTLSAVCVTHLHSDHYLELGPLLHTAWTAGLKSPVRVIGPDGLQDYWRNFLAAMAFDVSLRIEDEGRPDLAELVAIETLQESSEISLGGVTLRALKNDHPPIVESFALRFEGGDKSVVFSGDTAYHPPLADFARSADLLIHEAMLPAGVDAIVARTGATDGRLKEHIERSHSTAAEAGRIAAQAGARALALHHLIPADDPTFSQADWIAAARETWSGPLHIGRDGMKIEF